jgi:membrane associated rhomboid family serine protease
MIAIPYAHFHDKMMLPLATLVLVILNIIAYKIQSHTDWQYEAAVTHYVKSDLALLEFPILSALEPKAFPRNIDGQPTLPAWTDLDAYNVVVNRMLFSEEFQTRLRKDDIIKKTDQQYEYWKNQRVYFNKLISGVKTFKYGFVPAERKWYTAITSTFLHGGLGHLIGNMIFLVMIGIALEGVIGFTFTMLIFFATGALASLTDLIVRPESFVPSIGASGAVYGLMGAFAIMYGFRSIRIIFFFLFPFFIRFSMPAALLLIYWFGLEALSFKYLRDGSNINFAAHLGGLASGVLIALALRPFCRERLAAMD